MGERIVVGMSGGVDSAVAAALLLEAGFEVWGVTLQLWQAPQVESGNALDSVRALAEALHIPLRVLDLRERFYQRVVERFAADYAHGLTPNPCVTCNPTLKFDALLAAATEAEAEWIATGHYARVEQTATGAARLLRARSRQRDQSYMLYRLTQRHLTRLRCPLGELENKSQVREMARRLDLPHAEQRDSQDLCFLGGADYRPLLQTLRPESFQPGPILNEAGEVLGEHYGLPRYTIGQRSGLGIAAHQCLYVLALRPAENALIVGPAERLLRTRCQLTSLTFTQGKAPAPRFTAEVQIRYQVPPVPATIELQTDNQATVTFAEPQRAPAPGQSVVCYQGAVLLGGGFISVCEGQSENKPELFT